MKLSVENREKSYFEAKQIRTTFFDIKLCESFIGSAVLLWFEVRCYNIASQNVWFTLKIVFCGTCNIIMIQSEWIHRKVSYTEKKSVKSMCIINGNVLDAYV